jgi:GNAT superfamily N-acetyltransferase
MFSIRLYQREDRAALEACMTELQNFERAFDPYLRPPANVVSRYVDELLEACASKRGCVFVACVDEQVVGMIAAYVETDPETLSSLSETFYVSDIVTLPDYRGQGIGAALLAKAEAQARALNIGVMRINVLAGNETAHSVYARFGFRDYLVKMLKPLS